MRSKEYLNFDKLFEDTLNSKGTMVLPNVTEVTELAEALSLISRASDMRVPYQLRIRNFDPPLNGVQTHEVCWYPKIFRNKDGMGDRFDGSGVILAASNGKPAVFTFRMCKHVWDKSGAIPNRGWHPKVCIKCGFDASIDSGD
jgi:hypothetical protein